MGSAQLLRATVAVLALATASAVTATSDCPSVIDTDQTLKQSHQGWMASQEETRSPLSSIRLSEGDPRDLAWLLPDRTSKGGVQEWDLLPSPRGYWVVCGYANTTVILSRRLDPTVRRCAVQLDKRFNPPLASHYRCQ